MGKGAFKAWEICPLFRGIGLGTLLLATNFSLYYNILVAWILFYLGNSFFNPLPFSSCTNSWNTDSCVSDRANVDPPSGSHLNSSYNISIDIKHSIENLTDGVISNNSEINNTVVTSEEEFWQYRVLEMSTGLEEIGGLPWHLPVCFLLAWIIVCVCIMKGVKSLGKVVYLTATLPYILLTVLLIRGLTLPGGVDGILYYLKPNFKKLLERQVWIEAALQVFYSLGPGWGGLITMSSYNRFNNNCLRDAVLLTFICEGTSLYGGLAVFSILGFMAAKTGLPIGDVVTSGPGLGFIAYPEAIAYLPVPNLWAVLFFLMLFTTALDSQFVFMEVVCSAITDSFPHLRKRKPLFTAAVCSVFFLLGLPMCTKAGIYIFQLVDWYVAALGVIAFGILECIIFGWIYGIEMFSRDVELMLERPIPVFLRICLCFLTPAVLMVVFIATLATYKPPNYGSYQYPGYTQIIGWMFASIPIIPLFVYGIVEVKRAKGDTILKKVKSALQPSSLWQPNNKEYQSVYNKEERTYNNNFIKLLKLNIVGGYKH